MLYVRKSADRGHVAFDWLDSKHSFSFGHYHDPRFMGFRALRVINEDVIAPGAGFPMHGHADMEIITYMLEGSLAHKDSLGSGSQISPGQIQHMSAGTGVEHSEFNPSATSPAHLLQMWVLPNQRGITPSYEEASLPAMDGGARLDLIGSPEPGEGQVPIRADVRLYRALLPAGGALGLDLAAGRHAWVQVARGSASVNGAAIAQGDGLAASEEPRLELRSDAGAELVLFDLA